MPDVRDAEPEDLDEVRTLLVAGLTERWGGYDPARNPDIDALRAHDPGALVVVATEGARVVGCGVLRAESPGVARVARMSVAADRRRAGVASAVLAALVARARARGCAEVRVETTATWRSAVAFYEHHGFVKSSLVGDEQHFHLLLGPSQWGPRGPRPGSGVRG
jgi:putative acetyltransferase